MKPHIPERQAGALRRLTPSMGSLRWESPSRALAVEASPTQQPVASMEGAQTDANQLGSQSAARQLD